MQLAELTKLINNGFDSVDRALLERAIVASGERDEEAFFESLRQQAVEEKEPMAVFLLSAFAKASDIGMVVRRDVAFEVYQSTWHGYHESCGWAIRESDDPRRLEAMYWLAYWVPGSLAKDEHRALAKNMVYGIADRPTEQAISMLREIATWEGQDVLASCAIGRLENLGLL